MPPTAATRPNATNRFLLRLMDHCHQHQMRLARSSWKSSKCLSAPSMSADKQTTGRLRDEMNSNGMIRWPMLISDRMRTQVGLFGARLGNSGHETSLFTIPWQDRAFSMSQIRRAVRARYPKTAPLRRIFAVEHNLLSSWASSLCAWQESVHFNIYFTHSQCRRLTCKVQASSSDSLMQSDLS